jgi:hypothetical protein
MEFDRNVQQAKDIFLLDVGPDGAIAPFSEWESGWEGPLYSFLVMLEGVPF